MTDLLDHAVSRLKALPDEAQDDIARLMLQLAGEDDAIFELTAAEDASFAESLAQAERNVFASAAEIKSVWSKHGL